VGKAPRYFDWLADRARARFDLRSAEGRVDALKFLLPPIQRLPDKFERIAVANDLAHLLGLDAGMILEQFRKSAAERSAPGKVKVAETEIPAVERILLRTLLASAAARDAAGALLKAARFGQAPVTGAILEGIAQLGGEFSLDHLMGRLEERDRNILARLLFGDELRQEEADDEVLAEQAVECVRRLEAAGRDSESAALKARIAAAEKAGNVSEALALSEQLGRSEQGSRRRRSGGVE